MVITTLLDYCASFHSFKTDKKKLQMGHVTQHHQAINKPPHHTPVGARLAQSCPTAIASLFLAPMAGLALASAQCQGTGRADPLFSWRLHSRARQSNQEMHSSLPGPEGRKPSQHWAEWGPLLRCGCRLDRQLCPCTGSVQLAGTCCLLPLPAPARKQTHWHPWLLSPPIHPWLSSFCVQCSALDAALTKARGREGGWWSGKKSDKLMPISKPEKSTLPRLTQLGYYQL